MYNILSFYQLLDPSKLTPTEEVDHEHVLYLERKILNDKRWRSTIIVHRNALFVMDGHHRLEVARRLRLELVPVLFCDYDCVDLTAWRYGESITPDDIFAMARSGKKFPHKTTRHSLHSAAPPCAIPLAELMRPKITGYSAYNLPEHTRPEERFSAATG